MKKLAFLFSLIVLCSNVLIGQLKVLSNGKVAVRSSTSNYGDVQINIGDGDNTGLCLFKTTWNEPALKITADEWYSYLSDFKSTPSRGIGFVFGAINIGDKNYMSESGGALNINQSQDYSGSFPIGLVVNTFDNDGLGILSQHNSSTINGTSIYSRVYRGTSLTFASGLGYSSYNFYVKGDGTAYTNGLLVTSDSTLKKDIKTIQSPMQKIMSMRGVTYKYKETSFNSPVNETIASAPFGNKDTINNRKSKKIDVPKLDQTIMKKIEDEDKNLGHIGFLAQEIEKVVPEVVRTTVNGTKAIAYTDLIAILVEGMKEQQVTINELNERVTILESSTPKMSKVNSISTGLSTETEQQAQLFQNNPNPFSKSTQIKYYLPSTVQNAMLCIYDLQGKQLKQITIPERGNGYQIISESELAAGIYIYGLLADGNEVDVKRMILTK